MTTETAKQAEIAAAVTRDIFMRLNTMADMIIMGERIAWGSDTALMEEAADRIDRLEAELSQARDKAVDCDKCANKNELGVFDETCSTCKHFYASHFEAKGEQ